MSSSDSASRLSGDGSEKASALRSLAAPLRVSYALALPCWKSKLVAVLSDPGHSLLQQWKELGCGFTFSFHVDPLVSNGDSPWKVIVSGSSMEQVHQSMSLLLDLLKDDGDGKANDFVANGNTLFNDSSDPSLMLHQERDGPFVKSDLVEAVPKGFPEVVLAQDDASMVFSKDPAKIVLSQDDAAKASMEEPAKIVSVQDDASKVSPEEPAQIVLSQDVASNDSMNEPAHTIVVQDMITGQDEPVKETVETMSIEGNVKATPTSTSVITPPAAGWEYAPLTSTSGFTPPASGWDHAPPTSTSGMTPPASGWEDAPPTSTSGMTPPASGWEDPALSDNHSNNDRLSESGKAASYAAEVSHAPTDLHFASSSQSKPLPSQSKQIHHMHLDEICRDWNVRRRSLELLLHSVTFYPF